MPEWINRRVAAAGTAALLAVVPAACGSDDEESGGSSGSKPAALQIEATESGGKTQLTVPKSVKAGVVKVTLKNSGKKPHTAQLIRLEDGKKPADAVKVLSQDPSKNGIPEWMRGGGGVGTTKPGATNSVTDVLEPGTYAVLDDEEEKPTTAEFEVTGEASSTALPKVPATVTAKDWSFQSSGLKAGKNQVLFENAGKELHHVIAMKMNPGATLGDVTTFFKTEKGKPPVSEEGGASTTVLDGGKSQIVEMDLEPGKYALVCFITDRKGGPPHVAKGMIAEATVK